MADPPGDLLHRLQRIARPLAPLRHLAWVCALVSAALFLMAVASVAPFDDRHTIPALLGVLWSVALFSFIVSFQDVPEPPTPQARAFTRLRVRLKRAYYWGVAFVLAGLTLTVMWLSYRLLDLWFTETPPL